MIRLIRALFATPGAEPDAEGWATRYCAHQGLALLGGAALWSLMGQSGLILSLIGYAVWETAQWLPRRGWYLLADCVLDWCSWAAATAIIWALAAGWSVAPLVAASAATLAAGIWRRS